MNTTETQTAQQQQRRNIAIKNILNEIDQMPQATQQQQQQYLLIEKQELKDLMTLMFNSALKEVQKSLEDSLKKSPKDKSLDSLLSQLNKLNESVELLQEKTEMTNQEIIGCQIQLDDLIEWLQNGAI